VGAEVGVCVAVGASVGCVVSVGAAVLVDVGGRAGVADGKAIEVVRGAATTEVGAGAGRHAAATTMVRQRIRAFLTSNGIPLFACCIFIGLLSVLCLTRV